MFYILISVIAGTIVVVSRILNTKLSEKVGLIESSFFNYFTGVVASLVLFIIFKENFSSTNFSNIPFYAYFGGILGIAIVILNSVITPKMSSFYATLIIFVGQLFTGILLDCLTLNSISITKISGGILVVIGLTYNLYVDSKLDEISVL
ncbi:DMT family transporter [Clostridium saccharoperbutylacetonicum]|uniref:DMT family transporter n=1 Tax=Clostridium saccharoperbutylacetonicum TaxID=36745 RepID=UPI0039EC3951